MIYASYFISIHVIAKSVWFLENQNTIAIYVMVIGASVFGLGNSNGENYLGFLRIIRFGHCMKHLNRFSKMLTRNISAPVSRAIMVTILILYLSHFYCSFYYIVRLQREFQAESKLTWANFINYDNTGELDAKKMDIQYITRCIYHSHIYSRLW